MARNKKAAAGRKGGKTRPSLRKKSGGKKSGAKKGGRKSNLPASFKKNMGKGKKPGGKKKGRPF